MGLNKTHQPIVEIRRKQLKLDRDRLFIHPQYGYQDKIWNY
jgi:hypothetical protein